MSHGAPVARRSPRPGTESLQGCVLAAGLYLLGGAVSLWLLRPTGWADPVWPTAGMALGMLISGQPGRREGIGLGSFLLNLPINHLRGLSGPVSLLVAAGFALAATFQADVGARLVRRRLGPRPPLQRSGEIIRFMGLAGPLACLIGASIDVTLLLGAGLLAPAQCPPVWFSWWVADAIGVIVFAPLMLMSLPSQSELWQGRRRVVALPSLLVLAITLVGFVYASSIERREALLRLDQRADLAVESLRRTLTAHTEALYGLQSLLRATGEPTPDAFAQYTLTNMKRLRGLHALSWNPVVHGEELSAFEARQRQFPGRAAFQVTERNRDGVLVPAQRRPILVPVSLIEPLSANRSALGYDIGSDPIRADPIRAALAADSPKATAPIRLIQERGAQKGVLLILPIEEPRGFVVGVYRLGDLLEDSFSESGWRGYQLRLLESATNPEHRVLARVPRRSDAAGTEATTAIAAVSRPIDVGGRQWLLDVRRISPAPGRLDGSRSALIPLLGLLVCAPLEGFLLLTSGTERQRQRDLQRKLRISLMAAAKAHEIKQPLARACGSRPGRCRSSRSASLRPPCMPMRSIALPRGSFGTPVR